MAAFMKLLRGPKRKIFQKAVQLQLKACHVQLFCRCSSSSSITVQPDGNSLLRHIISRIKISGAISIAAFMQEVLTNPLGGYYMKKDVFGEAGDFITSPEISQVFGELIGVWFVHHWMQTGKKKFQFVELGPGRGTLVADILRVFRKFKDLQENVSLHLVEVSPAMSAIQEKTLTGNEKEQEFKVDSDSLHYKQSQTDCGIPVSWYHSIQDVPRGHSFYLAHEFFDALPIHQFKKTAHGWREILVDIDKERPQSLRFVLAPGPTYASQTLVPQGALSDEIEVCPQGGAIMEDIVSRIRDHGGCAMIVDYGQEGSDRHTLRSFSKHKFHDVLEAPGTADITANVDFAYLRQAAGSDVKTYGPVTQTSFLRGMGIDQRLKILLTKASPSEAKVLHSGYRMLMEDMGNKFKMFAVADKTSSEPAAFR